MGNDPSPTETQAQRLEAAYAQLAARLRQPEVSQRLHSPANESEWSAMQTLGHMIEMIPYWLAHCRTLMAATGEPPQFGRTLDAPERLEGVQRGKTGNLSEMMHLLRKEIDNATSEIRSMSPVEQGKKGVHIRRGKMSVAEVVETFVVSHAEEHVAQIREALGN